MAGRKEATPQRNVSLPHTPVQLTIVAVVVLAAAFTLGMWAVDQDSSPASPSKPAAPAHADAPADAGRGVDAHPKIDFTAKRYDPRTEPVQAGPKVFEYTTTERTIEVGDKVYELWTFEDTVPGPVQRVVVGDEVTIRIHNAGDSKFHHSVDYHSSRITMGGGHVQVAPGETGEFTFTAEYPGVFMYHCATAPVHHHIGMGMYGMMIVQPKEGWGEPMPEYAFVQSELYDSFEGIDENAPTQMAFNGIPSQYVDDPIELPADSKVRLFVLNAGPSELSSFHVVGTIFDRVFEDGNPFNESRGRQALAMPASGGGVFEMQLKGEGQFPFVTHQFNHVAQGAVGMFITGDGKPGPGGLESHAAH